MVLYHELDEYLENCIKPDYNNNLCKTAVEVYNECKDYMSNPGLLSLEQRLRIKFPTQFPNQS